MMEAFERAVYRSRQFVGSLRPRIDIGARDDAYALLSDGERALFESMTTRDQQHGLEVYSRLREQGQAARDLLVAALLHDVGKGRIALWHRVAYVLLDAGAPGLLDRLATPSDAPGWRPALYRCRHHSELGARLAADAGSTARVVELIRSADDDTGDEGALALKAADDTL
ncbi:MAG: hypothetical protein WBD55_12835 [Dehalococcoidia bacterium]